MDIKRILFGFFLVLFASIQLSAQYFGRNKARYEQFEFETYETPNFAIYHYLENPEALKEFADWSEQWYRLHQSVLADTFSQRNPLLLYNNHADFQQTNSISGNISVGTGGVTEAFKNRVVMPIHLSKHQTHHVLGHEQVHAFQYNMILRGDSTSLESLANLPLWMVEGMAEYLSIGREDSHTAMWMRDAVLHDNIPTLKELDDPKYFPYRYGQVFWAFVTGLKGDTIIEPLFMATAKYGFDRACDSVLGMTKEQLSGLWVQTIENHFGAALENRKEDPSGRRLISEEKQGGRLNIAPVLSPDGKYLAFLSEKDLFSIDLFLADARNGEVLKTLASTTRSGHLDDLEFIESAGTWSPDSKRFAFVAVKKGRNVLVITDVFQNKTLEEIPIEGVQAFQNPAWSPDGRHIVVSGLVEGQTDLYLIDLSTKKVRQLTDNAASELHPNWSFDGKKVAFSTDQISYEANRNFGKWSFNLAVFDLESGVTTQYDVFPGADNLNPLFDAEEHIVFLSDRDGFRNIYRLDPTSDQVYQLTDLLTGVSGITAFAPALTISRSENRPRIVYTHYSDGAYHLYAARPEDFLNQKVDATVIDRSAARLPRVNPQALDLVDANLKSLQPLESEPETYTKTPYKAKFKLDYVGGSAGVGVGNTSFGTVSGANGGVDFLFSDILGNHQLFSSVALNGELLDIAAVVAYINREQRNAWGLSLSHSPFRSGAYGFAGIDTLQYNDGTNVLAAHYILDNIRIFEDRLSAFWQYPFSTTLRMEAGASYSIYYNRVDRQDLYYDSFGRLLLREREKLDPETSGYNLFEGQIASVNAAVVGDNSYFGIASPLKGHRYRFGIEKYFNGFGNQELGVGFDFYSLTADYRHYIRLKPVSLAFRGVHYGRYGQDSETLFPLFLGYPWYVRGYDFNNASEILTANKKSVDILLGSKLFVSNVEVRLPLSGPERLSLIKSKLFFTELALFADGGLAWSDYSELGQKDTEGGGFQWTANPVFSAGASLRINLFGALIIEPYYAIPIQKETRGVFGLNFAPGW